LPETEAFTNNQKMEILPFYISSSWEGLEIKIGWSVLAGFAVCILLFVFKVLQYLYHGMSWIFMKRTGTCLNVIYQKSLKKARPRLVREMKLGEAFLSDLVNREILTDNKKQELKKAAKKCTTAKENAVGDLLDIVAEENDDKFELFVKALVDNGQPYLAKELDKDYMAKTKKLRVLAVRRAQLIREMSMNDAFLTRMWADNDILCHAKHEVELHKEEAAGVLLDAVEQKGTRAALHQLVTALFYSGQAELARLLDPELCAQLMQVDPSDEQEHAVPSDDLRQCNVIH
jgi:hypothetical protein